PPSAHHRDLHSFPTRRSSDLERRAEIGLDEHEPADGGGHRKEGHGHPPAADLGTMRTEPGAEIEDDRELRELRWLDADERPEPQDRKSTRLNSSHLVISCAVF